MFSQRCEECFVIVNHLKLPQRKPRMTGKDQKIAIIRDLNCNLKHP